MVLKKETTSRPLYWPSLQVSAEPAYILQKPPENRAFVSLRRWAMCVSFSDPLIENLLNDLREDREVPVIFGPQSEDNYVRYVLEKIGPVGVAEWRRFLRGNRGKYPRLSHTKSPRGALEYLFAFLLLEKYDWEKES